MTTETQFFTGQIAAGAFTARPGQAPIMQTKPAPSFQENRPGHMTAADAPPPEQLRAAAMAAESAALSGRAETLARNRDPKPLKMPPKPANWETLSPISRPTQIVLIDPLSDWSTFESSVGAANSASVRRIGPWVKSVRCGRAGGAVVAPSGIAVSLIQVPRVSPYKWI